MSNIKKSLLSLAVASIVAAPLMANAEGFGTISANVALTTDYKFRGLSQTDNKGAIQGGFDWAHDSGAYAGVWASNVDFDGETNSGRSFSENLEVDTYLGFKNDIGDTGIGYDVGYLRYNYNDDKKSDYGTNEWYIAGSYSFFNIGYKYSSNWYGSSEESNYIHAGFDYDLPYEIALSATVGKSFGDAYKTDNLVKDAEYVDYSIGISKDFYGLNFGLAYVGNDLSNSECNALAYQSNQCDEKFVLTVSKALDDVTKSSEGSDLPITANVLLSTDYMFRGLSQTDNKGAIQGGFDYEHESGLYAGVWASNVDFDGETDSGRSWSENLEVDTYAGFKNDIGDTGIGYDVGYLRYNYNDDDKSDYGTNEWYIAGSYSFFNAGFKYSSNWFGSSDSSKYVHAGIDYDLPYEVALSATVGKSFGDAYKTDNLVKDAEYVDYSIGVSKEFVGLDVGLSYIGNDLSNSECKALGYQTNQCDERFVLSVSKGF